MPLTNIEIKNALPKDKEYVMSDGGGLVILVNRASALIELRKIHSQNIFLKLIAHKSLNK